MQSRSSSQTALIRALKPALHLPVSTTKAIPRQVVVLRQPDVALPQKVRREQRELGAAVNPKVLARVNRPRKLPDSHFVQHNDIRAIRGILGVDLEILLEVLHLDEHSFSHP